MKKGVSIVLSMFMIMMLVLSFSVPVEAASSYYHFTEQSYTDTRTYYLKSDSVQYAQRYWNPTQQKFYDVLTYVATGNTGSFVVDIPLPLWHFNGQNQVTATGDIVELRFEGVSFVRTLTNVFGNPSVMITAVDLVSHDGTSVPINISGGVTRAFFELPQISEGININDFFSFRVHVTYSCGVDEGVDTDIANGEACTCQFSYSVWDLQISSYDSGKIDVSDIENQTNTLTNGYDNSGLTDSNTALSGSINDYDQTESQITDSSISNIDAAQFISPASNATLLASVSFCTSWLQSLFVNLGDWSLLVTVSLSLALGLMLIGWFKYR